MSQRHNWNGMYTIDPPADPEEVQNGIEATRGIGQLSLDENSEVRFHGTSSGMQLLGKTDRTDARHAGGIWHLPMARTWPPAINKSMVVHHEDDAHVNLPSVDVQDQLIDLYFTNFHPVLPVVDKASFMQEYRSSKYRRKYDRNSSKERREGVYSNVSKLLLLAIFAMAARYADDRIPPPPSSHMWEAGCDYLDAAREVLAKVFSQSRPTTCQALLLLGYREFGIGSMEEGWTYIGMAIRMAFDLGLNRNADNWQVDDGRLFSSQEKQIRKQIWWGCCVADKYSSVYMGRPVTIRNSDYDTNLPEQSNADEGDLWQPLPTDPVRIIYPPVPSRIMVCFRAMASLSEITEFILTSVYPVHPAEYSARRSVLATLETRLDRWYLSLPAELRYDPSGKWIIPPPHILFLHIRYHSTVLLLHRAFIPNWKRAEAQAASSRRDSDTIPFKSFDLCQTAASHISTIATAYLDNFSLKRCPPLLASHILSAGIIHVVTLTLRPSNVQASLGLHQCLTALKEMEMIWPSATRAWELLDGVKVQFDTAWTQLNAGPDRSKRHAEEAFGQDRPADDQSGGYGYRSQVNGESEQDMSTQLMAHMLGLDMPGFETSPSYMPGHQWWPNGIPSGVEAMTPLPSSTNSSSPYSVVPAAFDAHGEVEHWHQVNDSDSIINSYNFDDSSGTLF